MKSNSIALFWGAIVACAVSLAISVYYMVPGYNHMLVTHDATHSHPTHAFAFFALAVICAIFALVRRPKAATQESQG
jgi:H+/Cl- antiporter ClcA